MPKIWFLRRLTQPNSGTSGGQLKVFDYYTHAKQSDKYSAALYFSKDTIWFENKGNYWNKVKDEAVGEISLGEKDVLFLSGKDWETLEAENMLNCNNVIINIAQPRHTRLNDPRNKWLKRRAIRIAKSKRGYDILKKYGVNGPLFLIPDAIDQSHLPKNITKDYDLLVAGLKNERMARRIERFLRFVNFFRKQKVTYRVLLPPKLETRDEFLALLATARNAVLLPLTAKRGYEGFYLPGIEAMALRTLAIVPKCIGNETYINDQINCLVPDYNLFSICRKLYRALKMDDVSRNKMINQGLITAQKHHIEEEKKSFITLLNQAEEIWSHEK